MNNKNESRRRMPAKFLAFFMCACLLSQTALAAVTVESKLVCGKDAHTHTDSCYGRGEQTCALTEAESHTHDTSCYTEGEAVLSCGQTETEGHTHGDGCYDADGNMTCTLVESEGHAHGDSCYMAGEPVLSCGQEVSEGHTHDDSCFAKSTMPTCGLEEHAHTAACYSAENLAQDLYDALQNGTDKDVELVLNGVIFDLGSYTGGNIRVEEGGQTLTIKDGDVAGGTISGTGGKRVITILNGGSVTLTGSTVITGGGASGGAGVFVGTGSTFNMEGGEISGNSTTGSNQGGGVLVEGTFNMSGGTIKDNASASNGGGVAVNNGTFNMTGGTITGNEASLDKGSFDTTGTPNGQGGGVYVFGDKGHFNMSGGTISQNEAGEGGGVFIDYGKGNSDRYQKADFTMNGGTIDGNIAHHGEGGGIYIKGTGTITKGNITNNETRTTSDLGGGGIYIEADGELTLKNAVITNNVANGLGGGIAACVHGKTVIYMQNGALVTGNTAEGNANSQGYKGTGSSATDGYELWKDNEGFKQDAQDIFTASSAADENNQGRPGVFICNEMLDGGKANWKGTAYVFEYDENGQLIPDENGGYKYKEVGVETDEEGKIHIYSDRLLGVTSHPDEATIEFAKQAAQDAAGNRVLISGNKSATHGGGIGNNGVLTIGEKDEVVYDTETELEAEKTLEKVEAPDNAETPDTDGEEEPKRDLQDDEFTFVVTDEEGNEVTTGKNAADGSVNLAFPDGYFTEAGEYTFTVKERIPVEGDPDYDPTVIYDQKEYKVTITIVVDES